MPTTDQDARALTYLARRLRDETNGACGWDEPGTHAVVAKLIGQNLASVTERVVRHACDPEARTPGAIERPFVPAANTGTTGPERGPWCGICGVPSARHPSSDHEFEDVTDRRLPADQVASVVSELRDRLEPTATRPEPAAKPETTDPNVLAAREALATRCDHRHGELTTPESAEGREEER